VCPSIARISVSIVALIEPADIFSLPSSVIFEVSIVQYSVQYSVSVKVVGVVFDVESVRMLLG
jgi:hypothetical protein